MKRYFPLILNTILLFLSMLTILTTCSTDKNILSVKDKHTKKTLSMPTLKQQSIKNQERISNKRYDSFFKIARRGPIIPGLFQQTVPQGLFYLQLKEWFLLSNYMNNGYPSNITIINANSGELIKTLWLRKSNGNLFHGHVGGIAANKSWVWIASGNGIYAISLKKVETAKDNTFVSFDRYYRTEARASFASYSSGILWIGEFARYTPTGRNYKTKERHHIESRDGSIHHGWIIGYKTNQQTGNIINPKTPDFILSIPDLVQGIAFIKNRIVLSVSYGRRNDSYLYIHSNPLNNPPDTLIKLESEKPIPLWFVDNTNRISEILSPPMTEGITPYHGHVAVLFESGSDRYRATSSFPLDSIYFLDIFKISH